MKYRLRAIYESLVSSYWFLPSLMSAMAVLWAVAMITLDAWIRIEGTFLARGIYMMDPQAARQFLVAIAGTMITVAGVVFSITIVALSLAAQQFGPRLLRSFMTDRGNQFVLGTFISTFLYCLIVVRTVRSDPDAPFVPQLATTFALLFTLMSVGVLIYFIHHVSTSINVTHVINAVSRDLQSAFEHSLEDRPVKESEQEEAAEDGSGEIREATGDWPPAQELPDDFEERSVAVPSRGTGYIQAIDFEDVAELAEEEDLVVRIERGPGIFVAERAPIFRVYPGRELDDKLLRRFDGCVVRASRRTPTQDLEFAIDQQVEVALRALSPGINDPFTAIICIDHLGAALCLLTRKQLPRSEWHDPKGRLRVAMRDPITHATLVGAAFDQIRQNAANQASVIIHAIETLGMIAALATEEEYKRVLLHQARLFRDAAARDLPEAHDRGQVEKFFEFVRRVCGELESDREAGKEG